jgi:hypothetical protein
MTQCLPLPNRLIAVRGEEPDWLVCFRWVSSGPESVHHAVASGTTPQGPEPTAVNSAQSRPLANSLPNQRQPARITVQVRKQGTEPRA